MYIMTRTMWKVLADCKAIHNITTTGLPLEFNEVN